MGPELDAWIGCLLSILMTEKCYWWSIISPLCQLFFFFFLKIYLVAFFISFGTWAEHPGSVLAEHGLSCSILCEILVPWPGTKPASPCFARLILKPQDHQASPTTSTFTFYFYINFLHSSLFFCFQPTFIICLTYWFYLFIESSLWILFSVLM